LRAARARGAGRWTAEALRAGGHEVIVIARSAGIDLVTGDGLEAALTGVDAVVDATNVKSSGKRPSSEFFEATPRTLMRTAVAAGAGHIVALSIIGIDRVSYGYYQGKLRQEQVLRESPVPVSILRAAQFHEFAGQYLATMRGPVVVVPRWRAQPVATREVGAASRPSPTGWPSNGRRARCDDRAWPAGRRLQPGAALGCLMVLVSGGGGVVTSARRPGNPN
jgi:uncharacterized protein YbjT (DUF2867 family)